MDQVVHTAQRPKPLRVPQNQNEVTKRQQEIGAVLLDLQEYDTETERLITEIQEPRSAEREKKLKQLSLLCDSVYSYAEANRTILTHNDSIKTVTHGGGSFRWYESGPVVTLSGAIAQLIKMLKRRKLSRFLRIIEEVDKKKLLEERELIEKKNLPGVSFGTSSFFAIKPEGLKLSVRRELGESSWEIVTPKKKAA